MSQTSRAADSLLTEHFRYTPLALIDDIINAVNTIIYRGIEAIETGLLNIPPRTLGFSSASTTSDGENPEAVAEIEHGVHQLETLLEATVDKAFDKFEIYTLRNILTVPEDLVPWIRLKHYEGLPPPPSPSQQKTPSYTTPQSLHHLRLQLAETRKLHTALRAEQQSNAGLIADLETLLSYPPPTSPPTSSSHPSSDANSLAFFTTDPTITTTTTSLTQSAQFVTSQLPAMRKLAQELRPRLEKAREVGWERGVDWEGGREERRRYLEGGVARVIGLGPAGGEGRWREVEDVEGLERVVGGLGGGR